MCLHLPASGGRARDGDGLADAVQLAAMALSPLAALSLPLATNEAWQSSARDFGVGLKQRCAGGIPSQIWIVLTSFDTPISL